MSLVFVTADCPYGQSEFYLYDELIRLSNHRNDLVILPAKSFFNTKPRFHSSSCLLERICVKFTFSFSKILLIIFNIVRLVCTRPRRFFLAIYSASTTIYFGNGRPIITCLYNVGVVIISAALLLDTKVYEVHTTSYTNLMGVGIPLSILLDASHTFTIHSWSHHFSSGYCNKNLTKAVFYSRAVRCISELIANRLKSLGFPDEYIKVSRISPAQLTSSPRYSSKVEPHYPLLILSPASGSPRKGLHTSIQTAYKLFVSGINFKWYFYADRSNSNYYSNMEELIISLGLESHFLLMPPVDNNYIIQFYLSSSANCVLTCLLSSDIDGHPEGLPHSLIQASSYGVPIVATNSGATHELTGFRSYSLVPQDDPQSAFNSIILMCTDPIRREESVSECLRRLTHDFSFVDLLDFFEFV